MAGLIDKDKDDDREDLDKGADAEEDVIIPDDEPGGKDKDDGDKDDRRLVQGESDDDAEERRQRNREARKKRKERHQRLWEENRQLRTQLEGFQKALGDANKRISTIEEGSVEGHGRRIDSMISGAERALEVEKAKLRKALDAQDADAVVAANEAIAQITVDRRDLLRSKEAFEERRRLAKEDKGQDADSDADTNKDKADPRRVEFERTMLQNATIFARRNSWYDNEDTSDDAKMVRKLDAEVAQEGYNPATAEYWQELEERMKEALPHRYKKGNGKGAEEDGDEDDDGGRKPNGADRRAITAGSGNRGGNGGKNGYVLSKERVAAIKEAGKWDDPDERKKMIDAYKKYDRDHQVGRA